MKLRIVTPEELYFEGESSDVTAQSDQGEIEILPAHAAMVSVLEPGEVRFKDAAGYRRIHVKEGFIQVADDQILILTDGATEGERPRVEAI